MTQNEKSKLAECFIERNLVINGTKFCVKSIFNGDVELESAIKNIVFRKMSERKKAS